jgi:hypothetical protein
LLGFSQFVSRSRKAALMLFGGRTGGLFFQPRQSPDRIDARIPLAYGAAGGMMGDRRGGPMENPRRQAVLTVAAMILIAIFVLFVLPPAVNDSEKAFRLIVACAAIFAAILKWRRARRGEDRQP